MISIFVCVLMCVEEWSEKEIGKQGWRIKCVFYKVMLIGEVVKCGTATIGNRSDGFFFNGPSVKGLYMHAMERERKRRRANIDKALERVRPTKQPLLTQSLWAISSKSTIFLSLPSSTIAFRSWSLHPTRQDP